MKNKKLLALMTAATMFTAATLTACGNDKKPEENKPNNKAATNVGNDVENEEKNEPAEEGTKLDEEQYALYNLGADPKTLDISRASDVDSSEVMTQVMDGLTRAIQVDGQDKVVPAIAKSWDVSPDGLTWTFHLRDDALWSDGVPVTAEHFEYGIKRTVDPNTGSHYAWILYPILNCVEANAGEVGIDELGVKALDDTTLEIKLDKPTPYFLDLTYFKVLLPQRQDQVEKYGETYGSEGSHILSTGAFVIKEWKHDDEIVFEKNPKYYAADEVKLDWLKFDVIKEQTSIYNAMLSGLLDMGGCTDAEYKAKFEETGNFVYSSRPKPSAWFTYLNTRDRYFKNEKVRLAFSIAVDREELNEVNYEGTLIPAYGFVPPTVQIGGEDFRTKAGTQPVYDLQAKYGDPKALLIEGLTELGEDPDPAKMEIKMLSTANTEKKKERLSYVLQKYKETLGVEIEPDVYDWGVYQEKTRNAEFQMASGSGWIGDYNDPNTFLEIFVSGKPIYPTGWESAEYDKCVNDAAYELDPEKRFQLFKRAEEILIEEAVVIPELWTKTSHYMAKYLKGTSSPLFGTIDFTRAYTIGRK